MTRFIINALGFAALLVFVPAKATAPTAAPTAAPTSFYFSGPVCFEKRCNLGCSGPRPADIEDVGTIARDMTERQCRAICLRSTICAHFQHVPRPQNNGDCFFFATGGLWKWYDNVRTCYIKVQGADAVRCDEDVVCEPVASPTAAPTPAPIYDPTQVCFEKKCDSGCSGPKPAEISGVGSVARCVTENECIGVCQGSPICSHFQYVPRSNRDGDCYFFADAGLWQWGSDIRTCYIKVEGFKDDPRCNQGINCNP
jgi:hypothetical protein